MGLVFLVLDTLDGRRKLIRGYAGRQATLGALLSVIDFERTVRRAIVALSYNPTKLVREDIEKASGLQKYKEQWNRHVYPLRGSRLEDIVPDWTAIKDRSFPLRHKIVHGVQVTAKESDAVDCRNHALAASFALCSYALDRNVDLYSRLPVRRIPLELPK